MTAPAQATAFAVPAASEILEYHRLARARARFSWWRPLLTGVVGVGLYLALTVAMVVPLSLWVAQDPARMDEYFTLLETLVFFDPDNPWLFLVLVVPLILMIPVLYAASRMMQGPGVGFLSSVAGRLRWGWLAETLGWAFAAFGAFYALSFAASAAAGETIVMDGAHPNTLLMVVLVVLLIPFQAAAEEYVFRGYLMQLIGSWLRHPAFAIVLPVPLFVVGHVYDVWGSLSVGIFAVVAGWLTWRTGGLEAAIALHIVNNALIFLLATVSLADANASAGTALDLVFSAIVMVAFCGIVEWRMRRRALARSYRRVVWVPAPVWSQAAARLI